MPIPMTTRPSTRPRLQAGAKRRGSLMTSKASLPRGKDASAPRLKFFTYRAAGGGSAAARIYAPARFDAAFLREPERPYETGRQDVDAQAQRTDYDGHWKDALDAYLGPCVELFWPALHADLDWSVPPVFLDKELQALAPLRSRNRRYVDKLARVRTLQGEPVCLLLHVEVQARVDAAFAQRMFGYFSRLRDRHPEEILHQFAIATRGRGRKSRLHYGYAPKGKDFLTLDYSLPVLHLQSLAGRRQDLLACAARNPFALVVLAELDAARHEAPQARLQRKLGLVRQLYRHGYGEQDIRRLFRFIDSVIHLPFEQDVQFEHGVDEIKEEREMVYVSSIERVKLWRSKEEGRAEGREEGREEARAGVRVAVQQLLERRFGALPEKDQVRLRQACLDELRRWLLQGLDAKTLDAVWQ